MDSHSTYIKIYTEHDGSHLFSTSRSVYVSNDWIIDYIRIKDPLFSIPHVPITYSCIHLLLSILYGSFSKYDILKTDISK